jgi:mannose-6-phosphate isomerase class I
METLFLDTGTVHAIGAGLVIAEINKHLTSPTDYMILIEKMRDQTIHVDLALEAITIK